MSHVELVTGFCLAVNHLAFILQGYLVVYNLIFEMKMLHPFACAVSQVEP